MIVLPSFGANGSSRDFDHRSNEVFECHTCLCKNSFGGRPNDLFLMLELGQEPGERHHHFRNNVNPFLLHFNGGFEDCSSLHCSDFRINDSQTATTVTEHWVGFMQFTHAALHGVNSAVGP